MVYLCLIFNMNIIQKNTENNAELKIAKHFGFILTLILFGLVIYNLNDKHNTTIFSLLTILSFLISLFFPNIFYWPSKIWINLGIFLSKITNPIILFVIFFFIITPFSFFFKLIDRQGIVIKKNLKKKTYWQSIKNYKINFKKQF